MGISWDWKAVESFRLDKRLSVPFAPDSGICDPIDLMINYAHSSTKGTHRNYEKIKLAAVCEAVINESPTDGRI